MEYGPGIGIDINYWRGSTLNPGEREAIRRQVREELAVADSEKLLLSVGELIPRKNHAFVIEELQEYGKEHKFHYFICGKGVLKEKLSQLIKEKNMEDTGHDSICHNHCI